MADTLTIRKLMEELTSGRMRVPNFQRGFVWDPERVSYLMDSVYKGYPFGSILLWRTKQALSFERDLGPFSLPKNDPSYPTDYILDGQQRVTSLFGVFQTDATLSNAPLWTRVFFDLASTENAQDSSFVALEDDQIDPQRHFPIACFFDPKKYRDETSKYTSNAVLLEKIDSIQTRFKEAQIPVQTITTEDKTAVAIVFERVNQRGVELDTVQLLSAWTWSGDFDLNQKFEELAADLAPFGFRDVGADKDLLLRCCSAVLMGDPSADTLVNLNGAIVRTRFEEVVTGIKGAIDFLQKNLHVERLSNLPYDNLLVPLSAYFAGPPSAQHKMTDAHRQELIKWFWRTCFSRRYNSQPIKSMREDVQEIAKLKESTPGNLSKVPYHVDPKFFADNVFRINSVLSKTFVLMLAQMGPRSFVSGAKLDLRSALKEYNRNEFHHVYPRAFLRTSGQTKIDEGCFANICFLSKTDNNSLSGAAPSAYRAKMPADISNIQLSHALPGNTFNDNYEGFVQERSVLLNAEAAKLLA